jgi:hypothetical protein
MTQRKAHDDGAMKLLNFRVEVEQLERFRATAA